ncbi:hypothetical protein ACIZ62_18540 [Acetobacterium carbinolicum]|uniref:hypothetical protein n=1 Tax=Acetobacterium carbinolicum TaxID=52690 RepID=UPI0039BF7583
MAGIEQIKMSKSTSVIKSDDGKDIFQAYIMENEIGEGAVSSCEMMDGVEDYVFIRRTNESSRTLHQI